MALEPWMIGGIRGAGVMAALQCVGIKGWRLWVAWVTLFAAMTAHVVY